MTIQSSGEHLSVADAQVATVTPQVVDPEEFARLAAEVVALMEHHRSELRAAMAELTALQRAVRTEVRDAIAVLRSATDAAVPPARR